MGVSSLSGFESSGNHAQTRFWQPAPLREVEKTPADRSVQGADIVGRGGERGEVQTHGAGLASRDRTRECRLWSHQQHVVERRTRKRSEAGQRRLSLNPGLLHETDGGIDQRDHAVTRQHGAGVIESHPARVDSHGPSASQRNDLLSPPDGRRIASQPEADPLQARDALVRIHNGLQRMEDTARSADALQA